MARLCALLRAIEMRLNSLEAKRRRFQRIYSRLCRVAESFDKSISVINVDGAKVVIVEVGYDEKYGILPTGQVVAAKGKRGKELSRAEELIAMAKIESRVLEKAKELANHMGINVEKILNPPKKPKPKPKPKPKKKTKKSIAV